MYLRRTALLFFVYLRSDYLMTTLPVQRSDHTARPCSARHRHPDYKTYYLCVVSADGKGFGAGQRPQLPVFLPAGISGRGRTARSLRQGRHDAPRQALGRRGHVGHALHQAMEDGAGKARAGTVIWFYTIPERAASGFFLHFFAYPIDNPRPARYNNKVVRRQN